MTKRVVVEVEYGTSHQTPWAIRFALEDDVWVLDSTDKVTLATPQELQQWTSQDRLTVQQMVDQLLLTGSVDRQALMWLRTNCSGSAYLHDVNDRVGTRTYIVTC